MATQSESCNGSSIVYSIDDPSGDITQIDLIAGARPITVSMLNDQGGVKASYTLPAGQTITRNIPNGQRIQATLRDVVKADLSTKSVLAFNHRVQW